MNISPLNSVCLTAQKRRFAVREGECLGILGESGSGKSLTMQAFMGLLDEHFTVTGEVFF